MIELKKLAFEKINYTTIKVNKKDFSSLVEKGAELGLDEAQVKKIVVSCLKQARKFKDTDLPLAILEEQNISLVAEEMCIPGEIIQSWKNEAEGKLKILESILAVNNQEQLQAFIAENPGMESLTQIPLNQFIKILHKDLDESNQSFVPEPEMEQSEFADEEIKPKPSAKKVSRGPLIIFLLAAFGITVFIFLKGEKKELDTYFQEKFKYEIIVDTRDQQEYRTIRIGNQVWIAQNMNYNVANSICDSCDLYGRYYSHDQLGMVCPDGFKIPTVTDFVALQQYDAAQLKSLKGWSADKTGSDDVGFASIPAGFYSFKDGIIKRRGETSGFWTSLGDGYNAARMKIEKNGASGTINALNVRYGFPVRCISSATSKLSEEDDVLLDGRTEALLKTVSIGSQKWLAKNSSIKLSKSYCYDDDPENCNEFGRLYEWASALKACPEGTRLPNASDLAELKKNPNVASRLNLKFGGFRNAKGGYELKDVRADMWTASEIYSNAKYWYVSVNDDGMIENKFSKKAAMAVRCIVGDLENDVRIGSIVDDRDDQVYPVVTVGKQTWMAQNLNIALSGSYCYNDDMENCEKYGRLYVYSDAKEICPEGFYLPSDAEWQTLKNYISDHGNGRLATMLKSSDKWNSVGKDLWGMNILPSGSRSDMGEYDRLGERAYFWSSSEKNADSAYHWAVVDNDESFSRNIVSKQSYRAIRCVSDEMISIDSKPQHRTMSDRVFEVVE